MRMRRQARMFLGTHSAQAFKQSWTSHLSPGDLSPDFLYGTPPALGHRISATAIIRPDFTAPRPRLTPRTNPGPKGPGHLPVSLIHARFLRASSLRHFHRGEHREMHAAVHTTNLN